MIEREYTVSGFFYKSGDYNRLLSFGLHPNKSLNPRTREYPIIWTGRVGWLNVSLIQTSRNEIDFSPLPESMIGSISHIMGEIESAIRMMD